MNENTPEAEVFDFTVSEEYQGNRLDFVLSQLMEETSRSYIQKLIAGGLVRRNGAPDTNKKAKVKAGDMVEICMPSDTVIEVAPENIPLNIVYEDEFLLVVHKPSGMVVHPAPGNYTGTMVNGLLYHCGELSSINGPLRPGIVHRIDKDTSGLLMVAKNDVIHRGLADQLKAHSTKREYRAIVYNNIKEDKGTIHAPIGRDPKNRLRRAVTEKGGKDAVTHFTVVQRLGGYCHLNCRLETGRTHQIRVHMAYVNHPLVGDPVYGPGKPMKGIPRQMLHAKTLGFIHPATGIPMEFDSRLPEDFLQVLKKLGGTIFE